MKEYTSASLHQKVEIVPRQALYLHPTHYNLFFISLNLPITATGSVSPVTLRISSVSTRIKTLCLFSSPMVNLPCVSLLFSAKSRSARMASLVDTDSRNLTFDRVYSWPGKTRVSSGRAARRPLSAACISAAVPSKNLPHPPMNSVSPVNTARWPLAASSMNQQMLSCVWHGVCSAVTSMSAPILNWAPSAGVRVTPSHSLPPMMGTGEASLAKILLLPPAWSQWWCVLRMAVRLCDEARSLRTGPILVCVCV